MPKGVTYLFRLVWYAVRTALIGAAVALAAYWAFSYAFNAANIYIILQDGLYKRAEVVMQGEDSSELTKYFTDTFIENDKLLHSKDYAGFVIRSFNHNVRFDSIAVPLFSDKGSAVLTEKISSIDGERPAATEGEETEEEVPPPAWENAKCKVSLRKINGIWKVEGIEVIEVLPTPTPSVTPSPTPPPTPTPAVILESPSPT